MKVPKSTYTDTFFEQEENVPKQFMNYDHHFRKTSLSDYAEAAAKESKAMRCRMDGTGWRWGP